MLIKQFKKNYISYFLGIVIPALINFLTIPIFKNILGTSKFGIYSFYFSLLVIINASFSGGITQSIIRLQIDHKDPITFYYHSLLIALLITTVISIPLFFYIYGTLGFLKFSIIFVVSLFLSNCYTSLLAITQSRLLANFSAISESLRTTFFIATSLLLLHFYPSYNFLMLLFIALSTSYAICCIFLYIANSLSVLETKINRNDFLKTAKQILKYGGFLAGWFFFSYGISMANRFILAKHFGKENIGDFTASFDILNRSIVFLLSPVLLSLFPLVIKAFSQGRHDEVNALIKKLTLIEAGLLIVSLIVFPFLGFPLLSRLLHTPPTTQYLILDIQIICSTFIWQMAMLQHKFLELAKQTGKMLLFIFLAFVVSFSLDFFLITFGGIQYAGIGFLSGGVFYFLIVMYHNYKMFSEKKLIIKYV